MKFEGRIAIGLDEFMLRLGHIKVLLKPLKTTYGNRTRIARDLAIALTSKVNVPTNAIAELGVYLMNKKLAQVRRSDGSITRAHPRARYCLLTVVLSPDGTVSSIEPPPNERNLNIWYEDLCLADGRLPSKVGAVTVDTREISNKSGVSHLVDWSVILGVANRRLGLTAVGRAIEIVYAESLTASPLNSNPYLMGAEKLAFARALFAADGDFLGRLILRLAERSSLSKTEAMTLGIEIADSMLAEANRSVNLVSVATSRLVRDLKADVSGNAVRESQKAKPSSSAWHRMSSRLEALVDIGFLTKIDLQGRNRSFDYYYRPTDILIRASDGLSRAAAPSAWADAELAGVFEISDGLDKNSDARAEMAKALSLCLGPTGIHIDSYAIVASCLALMQGKLLHISEARSTLTKFAIDEPALVRLSRGYAGSRAEFASISVRDLEKVTSRFMMH